VFPVRYELNFYISFRRNSVFKELITLLPVPASKSSCECLPEFPLAFYAMKNFNPMLYSDISSLTPSA
jgi:hypothetical protein